MEDVDDNNAMEDETGVVLSKNLADMRVLVLQRELLRRGLSIDGEKGDLISRLQTALSSADDDAMSEDIAIPSKYNWEIVPGSDRASPTARAGHGLVSFCNRLYLFGGFSGFSDNYGQRFNEIYPPPPPNDHPSPHFNTVHEFNFDTRCWKELVPNPSADGHMVNCPKPRRHASLVVHGCSLFVYGGFDANDHVLSDMWEFNIERSVWSKVKYRVSHNNDPPTGRAEHTAIVYLNRMFIFGGYDGKRKLNETFIFDFATKTWSFPNLATHNAPSRRCKHTSVLYGKSMYVLGGFQFNNGDNYALTDLHELDLNTFVWSSIIMNQECPQSLQGHKAVVSDNCMYVVGGKLRTSNNMSANGGHSETRSTGLNPSVFCYDFESYRWSVVPVKGETPTARQLHAAVLVQRSGNQDSIYLFGGTDKAKQTYYDELWELRPRETVTDNPCTGCSSTRRLLNNEQFSDVHFIVENQTVYAHRAILYSRSDYFRTMFDAQMRESTALSIPISNVPYNVFLSVMEYLYTKKANVQNGQHAVELLKAADMFRLDGLRSYCVVKVEQAITVENVCDICYIADTHNTESLKQYCINFIIVNFKRVIHTQSFKHLIEEDMSGLGLEILGAVADTLPNVSAAHKRPRK